MTEAVIDPADGCDRFQRLEAQTGTSRSTSP